MTIEESNLFVEFLNLKLSKKIINDSRVMYIVPTAICEITYPRQQFKFDKSWDWLMPVVEKIENLSYGKWYVHIQGNSVSIEDGNDSPIWDYHVNSYNPTLSLFSTSLFSENKNNTPIASLYKAVVEFIKYYNKIKEL
tara:strand:- start:39 stop:452 length:414 start_codon:yes stop_codon:yes gene_type:complete